MKVILQYISLTIFLSIIFLSCEKNYPVRGSEKKLVLNSVFTADSSWRLKLTNTKDPYSEDSILTISDASISIILDKNNIGFFSHTSNGIYTTDYVPKAKDVLSIEIKKDGYEDITANTYIPRKILLRGLSKEIVVNNENEKNIRYILLGDIAENYYLIVRHIVYKESVSLNNDTIPFLDTVSIQGVSSFFENILPPYANVKCLFGFRKNNSQEKISFQSYDGFVKNENLIKGISRIEVYSCSKEYYEYQKSLVRYKWSNHDINTSIINSSELYTNVNNGLGVFAGFNKVILLDTFK